MINITDQNGIAVLAVNNPPVNTINAAVRAALFKALDQIGTPKALVLLCEGSTFFSGADIGEFSGPPQEVEYRRLFNAIENLPFPVVAAMHGTVMGGGLEIALASHYRVAAPGTRFGLPEVTLGIIPGAGGTQRLPRAVSKSKAMDLVLTARMMDAAEAERAGLVSRVVPADKLLDEALAAAGQICEYSLPVVMAAKESVNRAYESTLNEGILFERRVFHSLFATEDQKEGMAAFVEKRKAKFKHR